MTAYDISFKLARSSHFIDGYVPVLMDADQAAVEQMLDDEYELIDVDLLPTLPPNARLAYVRRDNGKLVVGVVVVRHFVSKGGRAKTQIAYPSPGVVTLGPKAYATGLVRVSPHGQQWAVDGGDLSALYVCKTIRNADKIACLEARLLTMEDIATKAMFAIIDLCDRLSAVEGATTKNNLSLDELRVHGSRQLDIITKLVRRDESRRIHA